MTRNRKALADATIYPFWLDNPAAPETCGHLIGATDADLAVIGGGFTGLWTAILAKQRNPGRDVVLIEAGKIAHGASGRPGGIVSTSVMHGLINAARVFPKDLAALERMGKDNLDGWRKTIEDYGIDADLEWTGEMTVAVDKRHLAEIDEEYALASAHGHTVVKLNREETQAEVNSPLYQGAMWSRERSGTVHPAKLAWGLRRVALELGVRIYEHTPMTGVEDNGGTLTILTHDGRIKAPRVLFATNAWAAGHPHIRRRIVAVRDRVLATEPLTDEQLSRLGWKHRQGVYDTRTQLNYTRLTLDNRIIFGGRVGYYFNDQTDPEADRRIGTYDQLAGYFFKTFPQLEDVRFTHAWSGPIDLSMRLAVHFQRYYGGKGVWAGGYSGFGVTTTRFGAGIGLDILDGHEGPDLDLDFARTLPRPIPPEPLRWIGAKLTMYALDEVDEKGGWRKAWVNLVHKMGFPL
ncbi:NAD(P)/FAD-dependent oxidoreductase [Pannonibacter phragmitetus]|uniref:NAD(P)/FAD-dependent oxidoreductase n=1 Tax=Pannonibacter phragmitetus TaxID=121719 RepID=UPI000F44B76D|nr:FAD-dependent oxidoreductase [Pannonibacter phragmitetus]MBA4205866.1 FAD-dependent oxidoreductase [Polymorphum sp.]